ncbi:MAG: hypothetical protein GY847_20765 [Proteobacteria bacterium]|nr:hypothetical protein [Pseudomonadota bacterium]
MVDERGTDGAARWTEFANRLRSELVVATEPSKRVALLYSVARVLFDKLESPEEAFANLDEALGMGLPSRDLGWEAWRTACKRDPKHQIAALEHLSQVIERPGDLVSVRLWLAKLLKEYSDDDKRVASELDKATERLPNHRGVLWAQAGFKAGQGDLRALALHLGSLARLTEDSVLRAALYTEIANIECTGVTSRVKVSKILEQALDESQTDWTIINDIKFLSGKVGNWAMYESALEKLAEAALKTEPEPTADRPAGHIFEGFERGESIAASLWWQIALVRERRRGRSDTALEAINRACELLKGHTFLEWERARLTEACKGSDEALKIFPDNASDIWKSQLALAVDHPELALSLISSGNCDKESELAKVLANVSGRADDLSKEIESDTSALLDWFQTNLGNKEAARIASRLRDDGVNIPAVRLAVWENSSQESRWSDIVVSETDEPWPLAVEAFLGSKNKPIEDRIQAFKDWADQTADLSLTATFLSIAAHLNESKGGALEAALDLFKRAEELDPDTTDSSAQVVRLMHSLGKWRELSERLAEEAAVTENEALSQTALHERAMILEQALGEPAEAAEAIAEIISGHPEDVSASWSAVRLAFFLGNWRLVVQELERLESLCPEDALLFKLLCGEIHLFAFGNYDEALRHFEHIAQGEDEAIAQAARYYIFYILYQLGDLEALGTALKAESQNGTDSTRDMWMPEILEIERAAGGMDRVAELLESSDESGPFRLLWQLLEGMKAHKSKGALESLHQLAAIASSGEMAGALRTTRALIEGRCPSDDDGLSEADFESLETLWHTADRLDHGGDPKFLAEVYKRRAELADGSDDLEWVDWMLSKAEAEEKSRDLTQALMTIDDALKRVEDHPGLLEARARISKATEQWAEAVDTHKRLASYYSSEEEKAHQSVQAAYILSEKLKDDEGAERICKEVLHRIPYHAETHEVLVRILKRRGDEKAIAKLLEQRIGAENDTDTLAGLYEEKADQMIGIDDPLSALEALNSLIELEPHRLSAYLTKIEVLADVDRWEDAIDMMDEYITRSDDPVEVRLMTWRASDLLIEELFDVEAAIDWLMRLVNSGDRHPDTERQIVTIATKAERWEEAADALSRLAELLDDEDKRIEVRRNEAEIRLEHLYENEAAAGIVEEILAFRRADLPTLRLFLKFGEESEIQLAVSRAINATRVLLQSNPTDIELITKLRELSILNKERDLTNFCDDVIKLLSGEKIEPWPGDLIPAPDLDAEMQRRFFVHSGEKNAASRVAEMVAEITTDALPKAEHLPKVGRGTRVNSKTDDPVKNWIDTWAKLLGYNGAEVHRVADDSYGAVALPKNTPAVGIGPSVKSPLIARYRFFIARNLWRSARGLGFFTEGDLAGPSRWVVAVAAAILGERIELPLSADIDLVARARKAMPRRLRRGLTEPCNLLLKENRQSLRAWAQAISFSADRFGLLAATRLVEVIPFIVEESEGKEGLRKLAEDPGATINKLPRCRELLKFALSQDYLTARRQVGLEVQLKGDER